MVAVTVIRCRRAGLASLAVTWNASATTATAWVAASVPSVACTTER